jgi:hypothetical protein
LRIHAIRLILIQLKGFGVSLSEGLSYAPFYDIDLPKSAIIQIWDEITLDESNAEIDELPGRMKEVIERNGKPRIELVH